jgi:hypothetical protein
MFAGWLIFFVVLWFGGYLQTMLCGYPLMRVNLIRPPKFIYLLFGRPGIKLIPTDYVAKGGVGFQTWALLFLLYGLIVRPLINLSINAHFGIAFFGSALLAFPLVAWMSKNSI